jgi:hypothetical protein
MDSDSEMLLSATSLMNEETGKRILLVNLTDAGLTVRTGLTEDGPVLLICGPTVRPRGSRV